MKNSVDFLKQVLRSPTFYRWTNLSYSQEGEDMILANFFSGKEKGFYIDIGAYHPVLYSNTYYFYKRGWRGVNIEARPGSMNLFNKIRPHDINIEVAVSDSRQELTYHLFDDPALNGFISEQDLLTSEVQSHIVGKMKIWTKPLSEILREKLLPDKHIDFISIDVEGLDINVLKSHDWKIWMPDVVLVEDRLFAIDSHANSEVYTFLKSLQYEFFAKTIKTVFFKKK